MNNRKFSTKQEKRISRYTGGKTVPNSGGGKFLGGDILTDNFLIEAKTSIMDKPTFTIKKEWLQKAEEQAFEQGRTNYALAINFGSGEDYYVINRKLFSMLLTLVEGEDKSE